MPFLISTAYAAYKTANLRSYEKEQIAFTSEEDFVVHALKDNVEEFNEYSCISGTLGRFQLRETMGIIQGMRAKLTDITNYFYNM